MDMELIEIKINGIVDTLDSLRDEIEVLKNMLNLPMWQSTNELPETTNLRTEEDEQNR